MKMVKQAWFRIIVVAFWCATIFNLSFLLIEVQTLKDKALTEVAVRLLSTAEEEDSSESDNVGEEEILSFSHTPVAIIFSANSQKLHPKGLFAFGKLRPGYFQKFSPPPEVIS